MAVAVGTDLVVGTVVVVGVADTTIVQILVVVRCLLEQCRHPFRSMEYLAR